VHVWFAEADHFARAALGWIEILDDQEREQAARFYFVRDRMRFIIRRGILRTLIGDYLRLPPKAIQYVRGKFGKPALSPELRVVDLRFNSSHSAGSVLYAFAIGRELGVDIERIRQDLDTVGIAQRFFSNYEQNMLNAMPEDQRPLAFFNCWTRKEAYIKAHGAGLSLPLDQFDVSLAPGEPATLLATRPDAAEAGHWELLSLKPAPGFIAALVVEGGSGKILCWQYSN
jgi:4'-phosphopantetheinyl transferase